MLDGAPFERKLVHTTYDGLRVAPLYVDGDGPGSDAAGLPGGAVRPGRPATAAVAGGWDVRQSHHGDDAAAVNQAVLADLERGRDLDLLGPGGRPRRGGPASRARRRVPRDRAGGARPGPAVGGAARWLQALCAERGLNPAAVRADLGVDPLGSPGPPRLAGPPRRRGTGRSWASWPPPPGPPGRR
ncbi:MAG: hypothetical protein R2755_09535 [Acidimicrobiales bacterium]